MVKTNLINVANPLANITITSATADAAGALTINFSITNATTGAPITGLRGMSYTIAKLAPSITSGTTIIEASNRWVPYLWREQAVTTAGEWPAAIGTRADQGSSESSTTGTLTDNGDGTYRYAFRAVLGATRMPVAGTTITYERNLTHRVTVMSSTGATATAHLDFVPDGSPITQTRELTSTVTCKNCHGWEFRAHGGNRRSVENCVTCHTVGTFDPHSGESLDMKVMIHRIHAGGELATIPGADGLVWDDPATVANEAADNGRYAIWGNSNTRHDWWRSDFPAVIENCTACHVRPTGNTTLNENAWKSTPGRDACGSCHNNINWTTGVGHPAGPQANDNFCLGCHPSDPPGGLRPISTAHDWNTKDARATPDISVALSVSTPANGQFFTGNETPVVTMVVSRGGVPIDHTQFLKDTNGAEGCYAPAPAAPPTLPPTTCPQVADNRYSATSFMVHGPRNSRNPVLTTRARAKITSSSAGPFDISAAGAALGIVVDGGHDTWTFDSSGGDRALRGTFSVAVPATGTFANRAAATVAEMVTWLNGNAAFTGRCIAYAEPDGRLSIRSRNLGSFYSIQLQAGAVTTAVFAGDTAVKAIGSATNDVGIQAVPANNDPKATWNVGNITYQLDPVTDLRAGTYTAQVEFSDRGRIDANNYVTPAVARVTFQVKQAAVELPPAGNCQACHQNTAGQGLIVDAARHNKILNFTAIDQCAGCHDYQSQAATGDWAGGLAISRRVHAIHNGANLTYPLMTVGYSNGDTVKGRNWRITLPQNIRNCDQSCHPSGTTSGSWTRMPNRMACMGCHDKDEQRFHMKVMTWDPTPNDPWSGDETESCKTCHAP